MKSNSRIFREKSGFPEIWENWSKMVQNEGFWTFMKNLTMNLWFKQCLNEIYYGAETFCANCMAGEKLSKWNSSRTA